MACYRLNDEGDAVPVSRDGGLALASRLSLGDVWCEVRAPLGVMRFSGTLPVDDACQAELASSYVPGVAPERETGLGEWTLAVRYRVRWACVRREDEFMVQSDSGCRCLMQGGTSSWSSPTSRI